MDLIGTLASQLGVSPGQAQSVAGSVLGMVRGKLDGGDAAKLDAAVPELGGWVATAQAAAGGGGGLGGMLGGMLGGGGGAEVAGLVGILAKVGVGPDKAALVAPLLLKFLESRVSPDLLSKVLAVAPMLTGQGGGAAGALGALGGLFK